MQCGDSNPSQSGFAPVDRECLESGGGGGDGAAAVPLPVPVLRRKRTPVLPALPAFGRCVPGRAVQYRLLRAAHHDDGAGDRPRARRVHLDGWRLPLVFRPLGARAPAVDTGAAPPAAHAPQSRDQRHPGVSLRGLHTRGLRPAPAYQGQGGGVSDPPPAPAKSPALVLVAAVAENEVIGQRGGLPWRLKSDLGNFRAVTMGKPVVMGRKTFLSIGKPLIGRTNIVVSRNRDFAAPGVVVAPDIARALAV